MIEPMQHFLDRCHAQVRRFGRPFEQQNRYTEYTRGGDLAVGGRPSAVLGDDDVDGMVTQQRVFGLFAERSTPLNVVGMRYRESRLDRIHAADQVAVLGSGGKAVDLLTPQREKYVPWLTAQGANRVGRARHPSPSVARNLAPGRATQGKQRRVGLGGCADRMGGDRRRVGMSCIDQGVDAVLAQVARETIDSAEATPSHRYRLNQGYRRAAGERQGHRDVVSVREPQSKLTRLCCAAENQDMPAHVTH